MHIQAYRLGFVGDRNPELHKDTMKLKAWGEVGGGEGRTPESSLAEAGNFLQDSGKGICHLPIDYLLNSCIPSFYP